MLLSIENMISQQGRVKIMLLIVWLNLLEEIKQYRTLCLAALLLKRLAEMLQSDASTICPQVRSKRVFGYTNPLVHEVE